MRAVLITMLLLILADMFRFFLDNFELLLDLRFSVIKPRSVYLFIGESMLLGTIIGILSAGSFSAFLASWN